MEHGELLIPGLLIAVAALSALARAIDVPYPILLVLGGLGLGFVPGVPEVRLDPDLVLVLFLPPLLYSAAFFSSLRDLKRDLRPISTLAIGLVLATTVTVAVVAHAMIEGLPWAAAFALGAIVSPTDPIAATTIARRLDAPLRMVTILEGESLINDGTALVAYKVAVAAAVGGSISLLDASFDFVAGAVGGVAHRPRGRVRRRRRTPAPRRSARGDHGFAVHRFRRVRPRGRAGPLGRARGGHHGDLPRLACAGADQRGDADAGLRAVGDPRLPAQRDALHPGRPPARHDPRRALGPLDGRAAGLRRRSVRRGGRDATGLDARHHRAHPKPGPASQPTRATGELARSYGERVGGHARLGLARRGARPSLHHRGRSTVPGARPGHLPDFYGDRLHAGRPGPHAPIPHPRARDRGRRRGGARGARSAADDGPGRARAPRRPRGGGMDPG